MSAKTWPKTIRGNGSVSVKIYRIKHHTKGGEIFVLAWHTPQGRQRQKFATESAAVNEAKIKVGQIASGRVEGASMTTGDRDELQAARAKAKLAGLPLLAALDELIKARAISGAHVIPACEAWAARNGKGQVRIKVRDVIAEYVKVKKAAKKTSPDIHASTFKRINRDLGDHFIDLNPSRTRSP